MRPVRYDQAASVRIRFFIEILEQEVGEDDMIEDIIFGADLIGAARSEDDGPSDALRAIQEYIRNMGPQARES